MKLSRIIPALIIVAALAIPGSAAASPRPLVGVVEGGAMTDPATWEAMRASGVQVVRLAANGSVPLDAELSLAAAYGIRALPCFGGGLMPTDPATVAHWTAYAAATVAAHPEINQWEIWNEVNYFGVEGGDNPAAVGDFAAAMSAAIRGANPGAEVVAPSLYTGVAGTHAVARWWLRGMLAELRRIGAPGAIDAISLHPYVLTVPDKGGPPHTRGDVEAVRDETLRLVRGASKVAPGYGVWVSEIGWPVRGGGIGAGGIGVAPRVQAELVRSVIGTLAVEPGIRGVTLYNLADSYAAGWPGASGVLGRPALAALGDVAHEFGRRP